MKKFNDLCTHFGGVIHVTSVYLTSLQRHTSFERRDNARIAASVKSL